jgi:hypothetical protein
MSLFYGQLGQLPGTVLLKPLKLNGLSCRWRASQAGCLVLEVDAGSSQGRRDGVRTISLLEHASRTRAMWPSLVQLVSALMIYVYKSTRRQCRGGACLASDDGGKARRSPKSCFSIHPLNLDPPWVNYTFCAFPPSFALDLRFRQREPQTLSVPAFCPLSSEVLLG